MKKKYCLFKELVKSDLLAWCEHYHKKVSRLSFIFFFKQYPEFRVQIKTRLKLIESGWLCIFVKLLRYFIEFTVLHHCTFIYTEAECIGKGLLLHHGFSSMISARLIGDYCHIYQQVTIGNGKNGIPSIGNNVTIYPGAKVVGGITIGEDVISGANCVVTKDIPPHSIVAGIPGQIIKQRTSSKEEWCRVNI